MVLSAAALDDLDRINAFLLEIAAESAAAVQAPILDALAILADHPRMGRRVEPGLRELVISTGRTGNLALYRHDERRHLVRILRIRHQRDAGYRD
ncbi:MAG: type II toxin-antitoxin system RelE/ParE family toxin [Betaproteobacteria bacterium]|nr:type II toxin-antitoxin system RelE/ParE family toxin [Betaproteobacteria bacterium]